MQTNRYSNRCSYSTMCLYWTIYFPHFYRRSWAFERHQLFLWPNVTMIRFVCVLTSTQLGLSHSFFVCFFSYFLFANEIFWFRSFFDDTLLLKRRLWNERDKEVSIHPLNVPKKSFKFVFLFLVNAQWVEAACHRSFIPFQWIEKKIYSSNNCNEKNRKM